MNWSAQRHSCALFPSSSVQSPHLCPEIHNFLQLWWVRCPFFDCVPIRIPYNLAELVLAGSSLAHFWAGCVILGNGMTFCVGKLLMNQHPFGWELSLTVVGLGNAWVYFCAEFKARKLWARRMNWFSFPHWMLWTCFWRRESFAVVWEKLDRDIFSRCDVMLSCWLCLRFRAWLILTERML